MSGYGDGATAPVGSDVAPGERGEEARLCDLGRSERGSCNENDEKGSDKTFTFHIIPPGFQILAN
jgi:hypothetical protein